MDQYLNKIRKIKTIPAINKRQFSLEKVKDYLNKSQNLVKIG